MNNESENRKDAEMTQPPTSADGAGVGPAHEPAAMVGPHDGAGAVETYFDNKGNAVKAPN